MRGLIWFRSDLRIEDNPALYEASVKSDEGIAALYIITPATWRKHYKSACQIDFILKNLKVLSADLAKLNIPLWIRKVDDFFQVPSLIHQLVIKHRIGTVYFNHQYEHDEKKRDEQVIELLKEDGFFCYGYHEQTIVTPGMLLNRAQAPFKIFTPFKKAWLSWVEEKKTYKTWSSPQKNKVSWTKSDAIPDLIKGFKNQIDMSAWGIGERLAHHKLSEFCKHQIKHYDESRDYPDAEGTSKLSPYLAIGVLSVRQCIMAMLRSLKSQDIRSIYQHPGYESWLTELIWREFYRHILYFFPRVCMNKPLLLRTEKLKWSDDQILFKAWCHGKTGIPIVDAAMRCLNQTGWMHNRLRMIVAMFLSKNLFQDWRKGEAYFMSHLLDGDFASNNGGWQWSASTGTDAAPYFRVFNPILQSEKFDPQGAFIRLFCPELSKLDFYKIHFPYERGVNKDEIDYPIPVVDLKASRLLAINEFKKILR